MTCLKYYAKKDENGFPIPGTMEGYKKDPCNCDLVLIEAQDTTITDMIGQSYHPNRLRYFVRISCDLKIIPNSLFISLKHPGGNVAEFKKTYTVS